MKRFAGLAGAALWFLAGSGEAALHKYEVRRTTQTFSAGTSPTLNDDPAVNSQGEPLVGAALVEDGVSPPQLHQFRALWDLTTTRDVPGLSGFIFVSRKFTEGPAPGQTGVSGSTASQIDWGTLTGWKVSGRNWCNSEPATICSLAGDTDEITSATGSASPFYDVGTWFFHGTGFTSRGYVWTRFTTSGPGANSAYVVRGALAPDGSVPAMPVTGVVGLAVGVVVAAVWARRRPEGRGGS